MVPKIHRGTGLAGSRTNTHRTIAAWLLVLEAGYVVLLLQPHHQSFGKRLVKAPKLIWSLEDGSVWPTATARFWPRRKKA
jgi:hypothetical protein